MSSISPENRIVHARYTGSAWEALSDISGVIISDPVAVSWGVGRIDVVAIGTDYKLYHWQFSGSWTRELVPTGSTFAVGQPALTSSGVSRLDILFRGHDASLYHVSSNGAPPFNVVSTGRTIRSFPAAASSSSTVWSYVVGTDSRLYRGEKVQAGAWMWTNVSSASGAGSTPVLGSPSVYRSPSGMQKVYARITGSQPDQLGQFTLAPLTAPWVFSNQGQSPLLGSPTATNLGAFIVNASQSSLLLDGSGWHSLPGYSER